MSDISLQSATEIAITDTTLIPAQPTGGVWSKITGLGIKTYLQSLFDSKVSTTGNETIAGVKTFSSSPIVPTPVSGTQASNKDYSDTLNPDFYKYSIVRSVGNLIANNSFETDLSGWSGWLSASFTRVTSQSYNGTASAQIVTDGSTYAQGCYSAVATKVGFQYAYSVYVKGTAGKQITMLIDGGTYPEYTITLTGGWDRITGSVIATTTNTSIYIQCRTPGVTTYWVDAVQVEEGTTTAGPFTTTQGNLTVALKNYEGNDPTPTKPVKIMIGGVVRTITSALSDTFPAGTNWRNAGSPELATKEIDYFCYVGIDNLNNIRFGCSRIASGNNQNDFSVSGSYTNEKYLMDYGTSFNVVNIGRFNATLSAGAGYTWSIPATSVIINSPIYETRWLDCNSTISTGGSMTITNVVINHFRYKIDGNNLFYKNNIKMDFGGTTNNYIFETLPFGRILSDSYDISGVGFGYDNADLAPSVIFENTETNKLRIIKLTSAYAVVNNANIRVQGNYQI